MGRKVLFTILIIFFFILIVTTISVVRDTVEEEPETHHDLSEIIGGILESETTPDTLKFASTISNLIESDNEHYNLDITRLIEDITTIPIKEVTIQGTRNKKTPYRGLYVSNLRDMRWALANIDRVKSSGFDTILFELQQEVRSDNKQELYIPAEDMYLFYLHAFHKAGFRIWLTIGHSSYDFPYRHNSESERIGIDPLKEQSDLLDMVTPNILYWAEIAEEYNVDTFIPEEEANTMLVTDEYEGTDLCQTEREVMNAWMQEILPKIKKRFTGKVGFATNDGGPCEIMETSDTSLGPDFDYKGYDFIVYKFPFRSILETDKQWDELGETAIPHTITFIERDDINGLILYETGDTVGEPLNEDFANSLSIRNTSENHQKVSYKKYFDLLDKHEELLGLFFKISEVQPHEPSWNPFNNSAEYILNKNWASYGTLPVTDTDRLWTTIGEEGLKAIQACISSEIPFDPEYDLNAETYDRFYHKVRSVCIVLD